MVDEKKIEKVNEVLKTIVYSYDGYDDYIGWNLKFNYTITITGQRPMISVGEYYDHLIVDVNIVEFNDEFTDRVFNVLSNALKTKRLSDLSLHTVNHLRREINDEFRYFFDTDIRIILWGIYFSEGLIKN
jgi:uncharacterized protein YbgA (DUF1722 family)